jgi:hypothetical protein
MWGTTNPYTYQYDTYGAPNGTYTYSCFVTDANGLKTTSPTYTLTIKGAPTITTQPVGFSVCQYAFSSNSLQVKVPSGASYQYQWYAASNGQPVNGETSANFGTTPSATAGYYCILTDPLTLCTTQSSTATITILPIPASLPNITNTSWSPGSGSDAATGNLWVQIDNPGDGSQVYYSITNTSDHAYDVSNKLLNFNGNYAAWPAVAYGYETTAAGAVTVSCYRVNANGCSSSQTFWYNTAAWPQ